MARSARADSVRNAVQAFVDATKAPPDIPRHVTLRDQDLPFWLGVLKSRTPDEWADADLVVAAQLARTQADIEVEQTLLAEEGTVIENSRGTPVPNPRVVVLENLTRREMALMRTLRMAGSTLGNVADRAAKIKAQRAAEEARADLEDEEDDLLAK